MSDETDANLALWGLGLAGAAAGAAAALEGFVLEPNRLEVNHYPVEVPALPEHLRGWTIAQVTDLHLGLVRGAHRKLLDALERREPDLVACTGDLVENRQSLETFRPYARRLVDVSNRIVAVRGNWEWQRHRRDTLAVRRAFDDVDLPLLENEWAQFADGVAVAGADDPLTGHFDADKLFDDPPDAPVRLFLVHGPVVLDHAPPDAPAFDLSLSGHTHGGQIRIGSFAPITPPGSGRFTSGFYSTDYGPAYVGRGVGMTRLRARFSCRPELPIFELR